MKINYAISILAISLLAACGSSTDKGNSAATATTTPDAGTNAAASAPTASVPTMTVNDAEWTVQDLSTIAPLIPINMKVPKNAKMEKNGNGGVDIHVSDFYLITVSAMADGSIKEGKDDMKGLFVNNTTSYQNGKIVSEENNGFIYTMQMKDEANGTKYQPETHFAYYVEKDGAIYQIADARPLENFSVPGSAYTQDIAQKVYDIVKSSAKVK